jgi:hypothetical protein
MRSRALALAFAAVCTVPVLGGAVAARADGPSGAAPASSSSTSTGTVTMTAIPDQAASAAPAAGATDAPAASSSAPSHPAPGSEATGFGWSTPKHRKGGHTSVAHRSTGAAATDGPGAVVPGFEMLGDGTTRVFVQMPKAATYTAKAGPNSVTYVLKDVQVDKRNNYNPLVTVHFNTPVTSARLVPHGKDLWLVVALRAKVQPTAALQAAKDGGSVLQLDFPKGDYLPGPAPATPSGSDDGAGASTRKSAHP